MLLDCLGGQGGGGRGGGQDGVDPGGDPMPVRAALRDLRVWLRGRFLLMLGSAAAGLGLELLGMVGMAARLLLGVAAGREQGQGLGAGWREDEQSGVSPPSVCGGV